MLNTVLSCNDHHIHKTKQQKKIYYIGEKVIFWLNLKPRLALTVIHAASLLTIRKELHGFLFLCIRMVPFL